MFELNKHLLSDYRKMLNRAPCILSALRAIRWVAIGKQEGKEDTSDAQSFSLEAASKLLQRS